MHKLVAILITALAVAASAAAVSLNFAHARWWDSGSSGEAVGAETITIVHEQPTRTLISSIGHSGSGAVEQPTELLIGLLLPAVQKVR